jgi:hypothetical protein
LELHHFVKEGGLNRFIRVIFRKLQAHHITWPTVLLKASVGFIGMSPVAVSHNGSVLARTGLGRIGNLVSQKFADATNSDKPKTLIPRLGRVSGLKYHKLIRLSLADIIQGHAQQILSTSKTSNQRDLRNASMNNSTFKRIAGSWLLLECKGQSTI